MKPVTKCSYVVNILEFVSNNAYKQLFFRSRKGSFSVALGNQLLDGL